MNSCSVCGRGKPDNGFQQVGSYVFCRKCFKRHRQFVRGHRNGRLPVRESGNSPTSTFYHWNRFSGIYSKSQHNLIRGGVGSESRNFEIDKEREDFLENVAEIGVYPSLTFLRLQNILGELAYQSDIPPSSAAFTPKFSKYCLSLAASVNSQEEGGACIKNQEWRWLQRINSAPLDQFQLALRVPSLRPLGVHPPELVQNQSRLFWAETDNPNLELPDDPEQRNVVISARSSESITGRLAYANQYIEGLKRKYTPFSEEFQRIEGLDMAYIPDWSQSILELLYRREETLLQHLRWYQADCLRLIGALTKNPEQPLQTRLQTREYAYCLRQETASWAQLFAAAERYLWIDHDFLIEYIAPKSPYRFEQFLDRISQPVGEYSVSGLFEFDEIDKYPLIECNREYLAPDPMEFAYSLSKTFYYDLKRLEDEEDLSRDITQVRGRLYEQWAKTYLRRTFDESNFASGVEHPAVDEIDLIAVSGDTLLIFEVKSSFPTQPVRAGDPEKLEKELSKNILYATNQLEERLHDLQSKQPTFTSAEQGLDLNLENISTILPIIVVGGQFDRLATKDYVEFIQEDQIIPYVCSIYTLDLITQILSLEGTAQYISERIKVNEYGQMTSIDEQDYLGFFVENGTIDIYSNGPLSESLIGLAETEGVNFVGGIHGSDKNLNDLLPELSRPRSASWFTNSESSYNEG